MEVTTRIQEFIRDEILFGGADDPVSESTPLLGGVLDSMALMRLVAFLEEEFGIEIDEADITADNFRTVADVARLVKATSSAAAG